LLFDRLVAERRLDVERALFERMPPLHDRRKSGFGRTS
jgi:hypothetical protein